MDLITNYGTLKAAVNSYLHRDDLDDDVPVFIALGISTINRECRSRHMETTSTATVSASATSTSLPSDYKEMRSVVIDDVPLRQVTLEKLHQMVNDTSGQPYYYAISGGDLYISPVPDEDVTLDLIYFGTVTGLTADTDTHDLLVANPNMFVYAAMTEAMPFLHSEARLPQWGQMLMMAIEAENNSSEVARWSGGNLRIESTYTDTP